MSEADEVSIYELFRLEAEERVDSIQRLLLGLHLGAEEPSTLNTLMREAHSLKGAARIAGAEPAVRLTHAMEDRFLAAGQGRQLQEAHLDALLRTVDLLRYLASLPDEDAAKKWAETQEQEINGLCKGFSSTAEAAAEKGVPSIHDFRRAEDDGELKVPSEAGGGSVRLRPASSIASEIAEQSTAPAVSLGRDSSEAAESPLSPSVLAKPSEPAETPAGEMTFRVSSAHFDKVVAGASAAVVKSQMLLSLTEAVQESEGSLDEALSQYTGSLEKRSSIVGVSETESAWKAIAAQWQALRERIGELQDAVRDAEAVAEGMHREVLRARLRPLAEIVPRLQRLVRSVGAELGKRVRLEIVGETTEVDTDVLERLSGPLEHLIRNALDHGLETPQERKAANKPEEGKLRLWARHHNGRLVITLSDNGAGIDIGAVRSKALLLGLVFPGVTTELSDDEMLQFLFLPGFSTRQSVSEISGRGFGMDAVQSMVQGAGGAIHMTTVRGEGTNVHLTLPISRSVVRVMRVALEDEAYALPMVRLSRVGSVLVEVDARGRSTVEGEQKRIPIVSLNEVLSGNSVPVEAGHATAVFLLEESGGEAEIAIAVDRVQGDTLAATRPLDSRLSRRGVISGVTINEDGRPMLIIDPDDLLSAALAVLRRRENVVSGEDHRLTVLVADDSSTVRQRLRRVLSGTNYRVNLATHGAEAWALLQGQPFDLLVSDVDMPELTGIELTERLRANPRLRHLPVVLLSYKSREEDRQRGLAAGADMYFSKGEFDDEAFLQVVSDLTGSAKVKSSGR